MHEYVGTNALLSGGSRIFPRGVRQLPKDAIIFQIFAENCMKMKEFGPPGGGGGGARPWRPPLDPPMLLLPTMRNKCAILLLRFRPNFNQL